MPDIAEFRLSRDKPMKTLVISAATLFAVGSWLLIANGAQGLFGVGLLLVIFAIWNWQAGREQARADAERDVKLAIDAEGLAIPEIFSTPVPWEAVTKIYLYGTKGGDYLSLRVDGAERFGFAPHAGQKLAAMIGDRSIDYDYMPLECDKRQLTDALRRFAPARLSQNL